MIKFSSAVNFVSRLMHLFRSIVRCYRFMKQHSILIYSMNISWLRIVFFFTVRGTSKPQPPFNAVVFDNVSIRPLYITLSLGTLSLFGKLSIFWDFLHYILRLHFKNFEKVIHVHYFALLTLFYINFRRNNLSQKINGKVMRIFYFCCLSHF